MSGQKIDRTKIWRRKNDRLFGEKLTAKNWPGEILSGYPVEDVFDAWTKQVKPAFLDDFMRHSGFCIKLGTDGSDIKAEDGAILYNFVSWIQQFLEYIEQSWVRKQVPKKPGRPTYIRAPQFNPSLWSQYYRVISGSPTTTNISEGWHHHWNHAVRKTDYDF